jgi:ATP-dependent 26S proteasome regulatory subunit
MMARAVASQTKASFIRVVGSEFVQKYLGEVCILILFVYVYYKLCTRTHVYIMHVRVHTNIKSS